MTPQWKKFTGSKEQIEEMRNAKDGFICRDEFGNESQIIIFNGGSFVGEWGNDREEILVFDGLADSHVKRYFKNRCTTEYLICQRSPHAEMIARHAMTGQPVYFRNYEDEWLEAEDWDGGILFNPDKEYSFNPPQEE
jgi:hypothetical protein